MRCAKTEHHKNVHKKRIWFSRLIYFWFLTPCDGDMLVAG